MLKRRQKLAQRIEEQTHPDLVELPDESAEAVSAPCLLNVLLDHESLRHHGPVQLSLEGTLTCLIQPCDRFISEHHSNEIVLSPPWL